MFLEVLEAIDPETTELEDIDRLIQMIDDLEMKYERCELPSTYHPFGLLEVGASRVILSHDRKLTELTLLFQEFVFSC